MGATATNGSGSGFEQRAARVREVFGRRPAVGVGPATKTVVDDAKALVQAEIALAKAELQAGVKAKGTGAGMLAGAGVLGWLGLQGLLITIGFALALVMPGWAAALVVTLVLLLGAGVLVLVGRKKLQAPAGVDTTKKSIEEDVAWTKAHLPDPERIRSAAPPRT